MKNLESLAGSAASKEWAKRGLGAASRLDKENVHDATFEKVIARHPDFYEWKEGRQARYLSRAVANNAQSEASREVVRRKNWERLCNQMVYLEKSQPSVEEIAEARLTLQRVRQLLGLMKPKDQAAFGMLLGGMTVKEIASSLSLSENVLSTRIRRMKSQLRSCIE